MPANTHSPQRIAFLAAAIHLMVFALACLISFSSNEGFMGGHSYYFFHGLWIADLPLSIFSDMFIFTGHPGIGLAVWGIFGTTWWYGLGAAGCFFYRELVEIISTGVRKDIARMKVDGQEKTERYTETNR